MKSWLLKCTTVLWAYESPSIKKAPLKNQQCRIPSTIVSLKFSHSSPSSHPPNKQVTLRVWWCLGPTDRWTNLPRLLSTEETATSIYQLKEGQWLRLSKNLLNRRLIGTYPNWTLTTKSLFLKVMPRSAKKSEMLASRTLLCSHNPFLLRIRVNSRITNVFRTRKLPQRTTISVRNSSTS